MRFSKASFFVLISVFALGAFEYFKVYYPSQNYVFYGLLAMLAFTMASYFFSGFFSDKKKQRIGFSFLLTVLLCLGYQGFLKLQSGRPLPALVESRTRCESLLLPLVGERLSRIEGSANPNICTLGFLQNRIEKLSEERAEGLIFNAAALYRSSESYEETTLVMLLAFWNQLHEKPISKFAREDGLAFYKVKAELDLFEGDMTLLETYQMKNSWTQASRDQVERLRVKKAVEISTLGKLINTLIKQMEGSLSRLSVLNKTRTENAVGVGQISLLDIRSKKLILRLRYLVDEWQLKSKLDALNIQDTYPQAFAEISANAVISSPLLSAEVSARPEKSLNSK
ncbi:MAG: hypothetical protein H7333_06035 [Bdellovibrionales bacterium]|nr:hypothetical protein [Oligoflexia bacterium]